MKIGLVGFAGSGKTTVFNAMTGLDIPVGFGGKMRMGSVRVPDERVDKLSNLFEPKKTTYAEITFCDVPGEHGAAKQGLSPGALQQIREQDALGLVLRNFVNPALEDDPDPLADLEAFHTESILADLGIVERRLERLKKDRSDLLEQETFEKMKDLLEQEKPLRSLSGSELNRAGLKGYGLLTDIPVLVVLNCEESRAGDPLPKDIKNRLDELFADGISLSASVESEIAELDAEDQEEFLGDLGVTEPALSRLIRTSYDLLDLISFFTVGTDEVRAWNILRGTNAPGASGCIHTDLERGFIRAEITPCETLLELGSEQAVKEAGKLQVVGKDHIVEDGDIMHVRFNV